MLCIPDYCELAQLGSYHTAVTTNSSPKTSLLKETQFCFLRTHFVELEFTLKTNHI